MPASDSENVSPASLKRRHRITVFYRDGVDSESAKAANAAMGATLLRPLSAPNAAVLTIPNNISMEEAIKQFKQQPGVSKAEADAMMVHQGS